MNEDVMGAVVVIVGFVMGFWNGWAWREIVAHRRHGEQVRENLRRLGGRHVNGD